MILDKIAATKREEVAAAYQRESLADLRARPGWAADRLGFRAALQVEGRRIISELKKASPSKGLLRPDYDPATSAQAYQKAGAACVSVLTDEQYFQGSLNHLAAARDVLEIPILRKDFTIDPHQIVEARAWGADAVLLIVAMLEPAQLRDLMQAAAEEGMDVLTEVHDRRELEVALDEGANLIGVNNRNLQTFETSINVTRTLVGSVPDDVVLVSESGFAHPHQLSQMEALGVNAFLIGETFMRAEDPGAEFARFLTG